MYSTLNRGINLVCLEPFRNVDPKYTRVFSMVTSCFSRAVPKLEKVNFGDPLPCSSLYSLRRLKRLVTLATRYQN